MEKLTAGNSVEYLRDVANRYREKAKEWREAAKRHPDVRDDFLADALVYDQHAEDYDKLAREAK